MTLAVSLLWSRVSLSLAWSELTYPTWWKEISTHAALSCSINVCRPACSPLTLYHVKPTYDQKTRWSRTESSLPTFKCSSTIHIMHWSFSTWSAKCQAWQVQESWSWDMQTNLRVLVLRSVDQFKSFWPWNQQTSLRVSDPLKSVD